MDLIAARRSVREYLRKPVEKDRITLLVEAALRSPSSRSLDPWEFVVVTDRELLRRLSKAKPHGADFLAEAPLGIVVCADERTSDVWVEDASIASMFIWLAAESMGLGACWIQIRRRNHDRSTTSREYVTGLLGLPDHIAVESIIAVGYPKRKNAPIRRDRLNYGKVFLNRFATPFPAPPGG